jgi:nucleoid-associated protein YgaU
MRPLFPPGSNWVVSSFEEPVNDLNKILTASALLVAGYVAASWLGPPAVPASFQDASPAGWTTQRLTPLSQSAADSGVVQTSDTAAPSSPAPAMSWDEPPSLAATNPTPRHVPVLRRDAASSDLVAATPPTTGDEWWKSPVPSPDNAARTTPPPKMPASWSDPVEPVRPLTENVAIAPSNSSEWSTAGRPTAPPLLRADMQRAAPLAPVSPRHLAPVDLAPAPTNNFAASDWGQSEPSDATGDRRHIISDGDSLPRLAERYLGGSQFAENIYMANRDVLSSPRLLPIGVELKIPNRDALGAETLASTSGASALSATQQPAPPRARLQAPISASAGYGSRP